MSAYRPVRALTVRELPDGDAVVARDGVNEAILLNATAAAVLGLFTPEATVADVARAFVERFPAEDAGRLARDVDAIVKQLVTSGILEPCGGAS